MSLAQGESSGIDVHPLHGEQKPLYVVMVVASLHVGAIGVHCKLEAQSLGRHEPFEQPQLHGVSCDAYVHAPAAHVPGLVYVRADIERPAPATQVGGGGVLHAWPMHGSTRHAPFAQPNVHVMSVGA